VGEPQRGLPIHVPKKQAREAAKIAMDGEFWRTVEQYEPLLRLINIVVALWEGCTASSLRRAVLCSYQLIRGPLWP
jgi:hypothetical protein